MRRGSRFARVRLWITLVLPVICFSVPLAAGYGWSAIGPITPTVPPPPGLETYTGRRPSLPITMEYYGAGVVILPFRAHVRAYMQNGELPLWNPMAGIGQPLAAQGEGNPYSPFAILRALLPPTWANAVTIGVILISALAQFGFLRQLGLSPPAAALGGAAWALSGALTLHIARDNLADQLAMIAPLFLAATWAVRSRSVWAYACFSLVTAIHGLAGFLPIAVNSLLLLVGFLIALSMIHETTLRRRVLTFVSTLLALALGLALTSPYIMPIVAALDDAHNKNFPFLAFIPMPTANVVSIFFPLLWGQPLHGWLAGGYPEVADWNNLFAYGSTGLLLLTLCGLAGLRGRPRHLQLYFLFFVGGLLFYLARYISLPPVAGVGVLPVLSQLSPKHTTGVVVFCLVVTAAFGADWLRLVERRLAGWIIGATLVVTVSTVLTVMGRQGARLSVNLESAALYVGVTLAVLGVVLVGLWRAHLARSDADAAFVAAAVILGELTVYLPLGNGDPLIVAWRIALFGLVVVAGLLVTRGAVRAAIMCGLAALLIYGGVVMLPAAGLPLRREDEPPPPHLTWLREAAAGHRVFGIQPDYASTVGIQDIEAVGPIAPREYLTFVRLISNQTVYESAYYGSTFSLVHPHMNAPLYDLPADYPRARPVLDWFGVRYILLEHRIFGAEAASVLSELALRVPELRVAYRDDHVTIVESPGAEARAVFAVEARRVESADEAIVRLQSDPTVIGEAVLVEASESALNNVARSRSGPGQLPVALHTYRPNEVGASFEAPRAGVFVLKDSYFPGWEATLDGNPVEVVRVNGMVRGVIVPTRGQHEIVMRYRPVSFRLGVVVAALAATTLIILVASAHLRTRRSMHAETAPRPGRQGRTLPDRGSRPLLFSVDLPGYDRCNLWLLRDDDESSRWGEQ